MGQARNTSGGALQVVMRGLAGIGVVIMLVAMPVIARAMHPLITDDTETQVTGAVLVESWIRL